MANVFKSIIVGFVVLASITGAGMTVASPVAEAAGCASSGGFLGFPHWYDGLQKDVNGQCVIEVTAKNNFIDIWKIVVNIVDILLRLIGIVAVVFIIIGGGRYIISQGDSGSIALAKQTITRAIIGLIIALSAVLILNFIANNVLKLRVNADTYQVQ